VREKKVEENTNFPEKIWWTLQRNQAKITDGINFFVQTKTREEEKLGTNRSGTKRKRKKRHIRRHGGRERN